MPDFNRSDENNGNKVLIKNIEGIVDKDALEYYNSKLKTWLTTKGENGYLENGIVQNSNKPATSGSVYDAIQGVTGGLKFKGTIGNGGTVSTLPSNPSNGDMYIGIEGCPEQMKPGDLIIYTNSTTPSSWVVVPSGDEPSGTVTNVAMTVPTGLQVSGSPITTSGTLVLTFQTGYSIPTTSKQSQWDAKQDALTAGENITIDSGVISATDTVYVHPESGITAGTYRSVTVDKFGHVTAGTTPTTISGYGITDAKILNGTITLGSNTITPLTQDDVVDTYDSTSGSPVSGKAVADALSDLNVGISSVDLSSSSTSGKTGIVIESEQTSESGAYTATIGIDQTIIATSASVALKLNKPSANVGSQTKPIYYNNTTGELTECGYTIVNSLASASNSTIPTSKAVSDAITASGIKSVEESENSGIDVSTNAGVATIGIKSTHILPTSTMFDATPSTSNKIVTETTLDDYETVSNKLDDTTGKTIAANPSNVTFYTSAKSVVTYVTTESTADLITQAEIDAMFA